MAYVDSEGNIVDSFTGVDRSNVYRQAADEAKAKKDIKERMETESRSYEIKKDLDPISVIDESLESKGQQVKEDASGLEYISKPPAPYEAIERTPTSLDTVTVDTTIGESGSLYTSPFLLKESVWEKNEKGGISRVEKIKDTRPSLGMTVNDILGSADAMQIVSDDMYFRTGQTLDNTKPEKLVGNWLSYRRATEFYNLLYVANHTYRMMSASEDEQEASRRADILFTVGKGLMYQEGTTVSQGVAATADAIWALGTDPTTWISLGYGNMAKRLALKKALAKESKEAVTANIKKSMKRAKLTYEEGVDYLDTIRASTKLKAFEKKQLAENIARDTQRIMRNHVKTLSKDVLDNARKTSIKAGAYAIGSVEGTLTGLADTVSQKAKMLEDPNYEFNKLQAFVTAPASGAISGIFELGGLFLQNPRAIANFSFDKYLDLKDKYNKAAANMNVKKTVQDALTKQQWLDLPDLKQIKIKFDSFFDKAKRGAPRRFSLEGNELESSMAARMMFLFGDEEVGFKGLINVLKENGVEYKGPRTNLKNSKTNKPIKDNFANWLIDAVNSLPSPLRKEINEGFQASVGRFVPDYVDKTLVQALEMDAAYVRESGVLLNQWSQARNLLYRGLDQKSVNETLNDELSDIPNTFLAKILNDIGWAQRQIIRSVVTHPGTTALNVYGWKAATMVQSGADFARVLFYGKHDMIKHLNKSPDEAGLWWKAMGQYVGQTRNKFANMMDPNATADMFEDLMVMFPDESKDLLRYMFAGIETEDQIAKKMGLGFIPEKGRKRTEALLDKAQMVFGVRAVDFMTKQQELLYSIDKLSRRHYGVSYTELLSRPDIVDIIESGDFATKVYVPSIQEARRNTFSMKYGAETFNEQKNPVMRLAKLIEDARKIPLVGLAIPFGQFINNTFAYMFDTMGVSAVNHYFVRKFVGEGAVIRDPVDVMMKAAVGYTIIASYTADELGVLNEMTYGLIGSEGDKIQEGLGVFQERDRSGQIVEKTYEYPESLYKALGRMGAHLTKDGYIPPELLDQARQYFITAPFRPLGGGMSDFNQNVYDILTNPDDDLIIKMVSAFAQIPKAAGGSALQMTTRPLEVFNTVTQLLGDEFKVRDRKQNIEFVNNSIRYIDEIYQDLFDVELAPEKFIAGQERNASGSFNYGKRVNSPNGKFFTMMNQIGKPLWKAGNTGPFKDVNNRLNKLVTYSLNELAAERENSEEWLNGTRIQRQQVINDIQNEARSLSKDYLEASINETGTVDGRLGRLVKISRLAGGEKNIELAIKKLGENDPSFLNEDAFRTKVPLVGEIPIIKSIFDAPPKEAKDLTETEMDRLILLLEAINAGKAETRQKVKIFPKVKTKN